MTAAVAALLLAGCSRTNAQRTTGVSDYSNTDPIRTAVLNTAQLEPPIPDAGRKPACEPACEPGYACQSDACVFVKLDCEADKDCPAPRHCLEKQCLLPGGASCTRAVECATRRCVAGVCAIHVL